MCRILVLIFLLSPASSLKVTRIDMSYPYDGHTNQWPGGQVLSYTNLTKDLGNGKRIAKNNFCIAEHSGTHLDAPFHFNQNGWKVGEIPFNRLVGPGVKVDIREKVDKDGSDAVLEVHDLEKWVETHGEIPEGAILLVYTGWGKYWNNKTAYFGADGDNTTLYHFPGVDISAAFWIRSKGRFVGIGIDTLSIDSGHSTGNPVHFALSEGQMFNLENVANLDKIPASGATIYALPMKLQEGSGAPCRVVAEFHGEISATSRSQQVISLLYAVTLVFVFLLV